MKQQRTYAGTAIGTRAGTVSQATVGETVALTMLATVAFTCVAIGAWSMLAFINSMAGYGVTGTVSGFLLAVTGQ